MRREGNPKDSMLRPRTLLSSSVLLLSLLLFPLRVAAGPACDVEHPPGPTQTAAIDTDEGTWMSVDVSPDGREVVFDLLGDIYTVSIDGGEAHALTHGVAWDMQPRYSPDSKLIAFTSDRGGGDNIWVMNRDGSSPRAVTHEDFRLTNSPVWTPDGRALAARKHYTGTRSLGAGEIWLYDVAGGDGVQMTKRGNDQKDLGEPAFSPDGRYLYFSQDVTPGATFEYNKDVNGTIYAIKRLDRETGSIEDAIWLQGGAVRPTPSHDGRWLAFVRRVRGKSQLWLHDLRSDANIEVYDGLDRDMQETWAIHGVYPAMAWTPDDRAVVFWAGGKLRRLDVASRQVSTIAFHVHDSRTLSEALRFAVNVAPAQFETKMLRWVRVSPDEKHVVFESLGYLWVRDLPNGTARRLTKQRNHFELCPSWSRDSRSIVYCTWNDDTLGTIRVVGAGGGAGQVITREPGHYRDPVFSPDGRRVVFKRGSGERLLSPLFSHEPGIYWVPAGGGKMERITEDGEAPQFGASADRIFLTRGGDKHSLVSVDWSGGHERTWYESDYGLNFTVSPDEKWLAYTEYFKAYVTPMLKSGREQGLDPKSHALPVAPLSSDAGDNLAFSGDGRTLHWSLGPTLYACSLHAPERSSTTNLGMSVPSDCPSGVLALMNARLITMHGDEVIENGTVVVERNRIAYVGPTEGARLPSGALVVDCHGKTIMPGLVDVHWHGPQGVDQVIPQRNYVDYCGLAFGVTTLHDPSNDTHEVFAAAEMQRAGEIVAPRIFSTGTILYGARTPFMADVNSLADARRHVRRMRDVGAISVKSYNQPRRDQRQQIIAAARELHMMVVPEGGSVLEHNLTQVIDGHTGVEHSLPVARNYKDIVQLWSQTQVGWTPTLIVAYGGIMGENYWYAHTHVWEDERLARFVPREVIDARSRRPFIAPEEEYNHVRSAENAKRLVDAGVSVQLGAHGQREGLGAHWELWMFCQGGMTPLQALRCGTLNGAHYLGMDKDIGSLEVGKLADLDVLDKNPLEDIRNSESVRYVMVNGRLYDAASMDEIGNHPRQRGRFFWEATPATPAPARATPRT